MVLSPLLHYTAAAWRARSVPADAISEASLRLWQGAKHRRGFFQRHGFGANIGAQSSRFQRRSNGNILVLTAKIVQQRLALMTEGKLEKRDEGPFFNLQFFQPWSHGEP